MTPKKLLRISGMVASTILPAGMLWLALKIRQRKRVAVLGETARRSEDWVLTATTMACEDGGQTELVNILTFCDFIQHAIPGRAQYSTSLLS